MASTQAGTSPRAMKASKKCKDCDLLHEAGNCRAKGKTCFNCNGVGHYPRACPNNRGRPKEYNKRRSTSEGATKKRVDNRQVTSDSNSSDEGSQVGRVASNRMWPGVKENTRDDWAYKVDEERKRSKGNRWVTVRLQGEKARLFADTGCIHTLISQELYSKKMGKLGQAKRTLRAWGAPEKLGVKGMFRTTVTPNKGATCNSWVYVAARHWP